jgi:hypothetical protein
MPLVICPDCGKEHSDKAVSCPQCGRPNKNNSGKPESAVGKEATKSQGCLIGCLGLFVLVGLLVVFGSLLPEANKPDAWDEIAAKVNCEDRIKKLLRDPDSYQFTSAQILSTSGANKEYGTAIITYRAKNGFGGYNNGTASCESYPNKGEKWVRAKLD